MIEVKDLTKSYNDRAAVRGISFRVNKGEILGLLGPNGAGKSTTMKVITGYLPATSGTVFVNGHDISKHSILAKRSIGYLPETPPVYPNMQVRDYLDFTARLHGVKPNFVKRQIEDAMEKCGISSVQDRLIGNLSKGYRQRVGLAQAIAHNPPVLILDEPTVGLDPKQIIDIRNLIKGLAGDHTVVLSTHILPEVQAACSRVVVIDRGQVLAEDSLQGIAGRLQSNTRVTVTCKADPTKLVSDLLKLQGVLAAEAQGLNKEGEYSLWIECHKSVDPRAHISEVLVANNLGLLSLSKETLSLEEAFVRLVTSENAEAKEV